jgi:hypothetical protein
MRRTVMCVTALLTSFGIDTWGGSPQELQAWFSQKIARWQNLVKTANLKFE